MAVHSLQPATITDSVHSRSQFLPNKIDLFTVRTGEFFADPTHPCVTLNLNSQTGNEAKILHPFSASHRQTTEMRDATKRVWPELLAHLSFANLRAYCSLGCRGKPADGTKQNRMFNHLAQLAELSARARAFIESGEDDPASFNALALELFAFQFEHNPPYRAFCLSIGARPSAVRHWTDIPAIVTSAFKMGEWTVLPREHRARVFHSSGTTAREPSRHFHCADTIAVYEASLRAWFKPHVLPDRASARFVFLSPRPADAPHSSLAHMFETVAAAFGSAAWHASVDAEGTWVLEAQSLTDALAHNEEPVVICGTAFSFVHLHDWFAAHGVKLRLPAGSRAFETGGYKGRSRTVPKEELHGMIAAMLGLPDSAIIAEYGMSELSSQAYDRAFGKSGPRWFRFPPWARATIVSPETGRPVPDGEAGLLRVCDLANVASVTMVQTEDLAVRRSDRFELLGRAALAEPRGCSLMPAP